MTRIEAEHILDAYKHASGLYGGEKAAKAIREIILDAIITTSNCNTCLYNTCMYLRTTNSSVGKVDND